MAIQMELYELKNLCMEMASLESCQLCKTDCPGKRPHFTT